MQMDSRASPWVMVARGPRAIDRYRSATGGAAMDMFTIVPVFIGVVFVIGIGAIIFSAAKGIAEWSHNNSQPVLSVPARVVAKRTATSGHVSSNSGGHVSTTYFATFELESGERLEFSMSGKEYGQLAESDAGILTYQGTRYHGFQRHAELGAAADRGGRGAF